MFVYLTWNTVVEIICFLVALVTLTKDKSIEWKGLVVFLFITCVVEIVGIYIKRLYFVDHKMHPNNWLYNILLVFEAVFTSLMFSSVLKKYKNSKPMIICGLTVMILIYAYETLTLGFLKKHNLTTSIMSVFFVLYCLYYFYQLIKDDVYIDLKYSAEFWWVTGAFFFYFGSTLSNLFYYKLSAVVVTPDHKLIYYIYIALNLILYTLWSYSFICRKWMTSKV